jgi:hypothetical protein
MHAAILLQLPNYNLHALWASSAAQSAGTSEQPATQPATRLPCLAASPPSGLLAPPRRAAHPPSNPRSSLPVGLLHRPRHEAGLYQPGPPPPAASPPPAGAPPRAPAAACPRRAPPTGCARQQRLLCGARAAPACGGGQARRARCQTVHWRCPRSAQSAASSVFLINLLLPSSAGRVHDKRLCISASSAAATAL